jgi:chemotaxis response regulator CheB
LAEGKIKVFVVDHSEVWRRILAAQINSSSEMEVVGEINSGQGAILMLEEIDPDVVMLEANIKDRMPLKDIIANLRLIKPGVRVLLCVDRRKKDSVIQTIDDDVFDFVIKPYERNTVIRSIIECMQ